MELDTNRTNLSQVLVLFYLISWPLKLRIFTTWSSWWYPNVMFLFVFFKGMQLKWLKLFSSKFEKWHHENKVIEELCQQATVPSITRVRNNLIQWLSKKRHRTPETCFRIICVRICTLKGANRPHMSAILVLGAVHVILNWPMIIVINSNLQWEDLRRLNCCQPPDFQMQVSKWGAFCTVTFRLIGASMYNIQEVRCRREGQWNQICHRHQNVSPKRVFSPFSSQNGYNCHILIMSRLLRIRWW